MSTITQTDAGPTVLIHKKLVILQSDKWATNGSIALGLLLNADKSPSCFCLFWEWGGDWSTFGDSEQYDPGSLNGWEPAAVREAVAAAIDAAPECAEDMDWFMDWASTAESTLKDKATQ